ncbi:MAG: GAF domain-containing protein [Chloroflexota bacterium]|nr:GAF domain-containing protein [Chloroflexota bacterium]
MNKVNFRRFGATAFQYASIGFLAGLLFSFLAAIIELNAQRLPLETASFVRIYQSNTLFWLINAVPIVLGVVGAFVGHRQEILQDQNSALTVRETEMKTMQTTIEQEVAQRTAELKKANALISQRAAQLKAITDLSEAIAQVQHLNEVFPAATHLISKHFGFYHVGIFLIDQAREYAVLQAANSSGGERMLQRGHRLKLGVGVVGFAAQTGEPRIALDVGTDAVFFNNPDLPQTRSEVALPLKARDDTIGVIDVQSTEPGAFSTEDLEVLTTLANQVSIALENSRLLTEARAAYKQVQEIYNEFTRSEWSHIVNRTEQPGFRYRTGRIEMLENALHTPEIELAVQNREVATGHANGTAENRPTLAVPVKLRGEVVGVLHIESDDPLRQWHVDEVSLVQAVAERAAFAMENARLFQDARRRAAKERLISEATTRISGVFNVENILQTTAEELERVLGGSEISIHFQRKESS